MKQYNELMRKIIDEGEWVANERTGKKCKVVINADLTYSEFPIVTTRKSYWKSAVAEFLGYIRGYTSAADFRELGTKTWDANANENPAWLKNMYRQGEDDMGRVYGAQGRGWRKPEYYEYITYNDLKSIDTYDYNTKPLIVDQLKKVYENLKQGKDDRAEIISFYNPGEFHMGCLRPCVHTHNFSLVNGTLHLTSYQRSCDVPLGLNFNMVQLYFFLHVMAQITGNKAGNVYHKIVNAHIYEDQYELAKEEASRPWEGWTEEVYAGHGNIDFIDHLFPQSTFHINPEIKSLEDLETWVTLEDFKVEGYESHEAIQYPFSV